MFALSSENYFSIGSVTHLCTPSRRAREVYTAVKRSSQIVSSRFACASVFSGWTLRGLYPSSRLTSVSVTHPTNQTFLLALLTGNQWFTGSV